MSQILQKQGCAKDPYVSGKPSPLFWITASEFLREPGDLFEKIWATPVDKTLYALLPLVVPSPRPAVLSTAPEPLEDLEIHY